MIAIFKSLSKTLYKDGFSDRFKKYVGKPIQIKPTSVAGYKQVKYVWDCDYCKLYLTKEDVSFKELGKKCRKKICEKYDIERKDMKCYGYCDFCEVE